VKARGAPVVTVDVTNAPYPGTKTYGALVTAREGNRKHQYRISVAAESAKEAGRKALQMFNDVGLDAYRARKVVCPG